MKKIELLAPAGSMEAFVGAINAGADAVYLGGDRFGARAYADNFHTKELAECIRYAHIRGRRVYMTVNTLMKEKELQELYEYLLPVYQAGLDGVIVQDIGAFLYIKRNFPGLELHVSTQMTVTGVRSARMLKQLGAVRVVPARELDLEELWKIKKETGLELEAFVHGAMCYCYSGQCLFSSMLGGRSGNRGRCAQPCRLPYSVEIDGEKTGECYPLSLKDMCTIEDLGELMAGPIDSFKIEGRMKKAEFAAGVTEIYRKYMDGLYSARADHKNPALNPSDLRDLSSLYIRSERQNGYYHKYNGADMVTIHSPAYNGSDEALLRRIREQFIEDGSAGGKNAIRRIAVSIYAVFRCGEKASVTFQRGELSVTIEGHAVETAQSRPIGREEIAKQLKKLGDTGFTAENLYVDTDQQSFYSLKEINELRREAVRQLEDAMILAHGLLPGREVPIRVPMSVPMEKPMEESTEKFLEEPGKTILRNKERVWNVLISTEEQGRALIDFLQEKPSLTIRIIYLESELLTKDSAEITELVERLRRHGAVYAALPYMMRAKDEGLVKMLLQRSEQLGLEGCLVRNLEEYSYLSECGYTGAIALDTGIYIWNRETFLFWMERVSSLCCPVELSAGEWQSLFADADTLVEKPVYGHLPMMITANCIARTTGKCLQSRPGHRDGSTGRAALWDRYHKRLPAALHCEYCTNVIYNAVPLSLHKACITWSAQITPRLGFTVESGQMTRKILDFYDAAANGRREEPPFSEFTTGHEKRGVE